MALRLLAFKQIYKILGMDKLETINYNLTNPPKKRQHPYGDNESKFIAKVLIYNFCSKIMS